jgi:hypothetical protein
MMRWFIWDKDAGQGEGDVMRPGTSPINFSDRQSAELHLERLDRADVARGRYVVFEAPA